MLTTRLAAEGLRSVLSGFGVGLASVENILGYPFKLESAALPLVLRKDNSSHKVLLNLCELWIVDVWRHVFGIIMSGL